MHGLIDAARAPRKGELRKRGLCCRERDLATLSPARYPSVMSRAAHWDRVYAGKAEAELSWTQAEPAMSLALIEEVASAGARVIDVGGGTSPLAERLLDRGYAVAVLDISTQAIERARQRMGERALRVQWIVADVTAEPDLSGFDVWHDRAVFHFLVDRPDRQTYAALIEACPSPRGLRHHRDLRARRPGKVQRAARAALRCDGAGRGAGGGV